MKWLLQFECVIEQNSGLSSGIKCAFHYSKLHDGSSLQIYHQILHTIVITVISSGILHVMATFRYTSESIGEHIVFCNIFCWAH